MNLFITIHAEVTKNGDTIVQVRGVTDSRQHGATGSNASDNEFLGVEATEDNFQVGAKESRNTALGDDDLVLGGDQGGFDGKVTLLEQASGSDAGHGAVGWVSFGVARTESGDDMDDLDVVHAGCVNSLIQALEVCSGVAWNHVEDALLNVEDEKRGGSHGEFAEIWMIV